MLLSLAVALGVVGGAAPLAAEQPATEAIADILIANDMAEMCPQNVRRAGPQEREAFIVEGIRTLIGDGHDARALKAVPQTVPASQMFALIDAKLAARGVSFDRPEELCRFAGGIAGKNDRVGRFLVKQ